MSDEDLLARLDVLSRKLDSEGSYVRANTVLLAIDRIKRAIQLISEGEQEREGNGYASKPDSIESPANARVSLARGVGKGFLDWWLA